MVCVRGCVGVRSGLRPDDLNARGVECVAAVVHYAIMHLRRFLAPTPALLLVLLASLNSCHMYSLERFYI